ncbi:lipid-A-disaccharide synthase [Rickettsia endosymbiont of Halotydeus destructor]|uniref:lipid-A-disaccharide synthase n=1 Tax=Rickettsia endosymbiont of Halotydeus destructor TaxID=2996754 RepID=UPI003BAFD5A9
MAKIYFIAGEISGDFIGSRIIRHLKNNNQGLEFTGIGGKLMEEEGITKSLFPITEISLMGFIEIIPNIFKIKRLINLTIEDIINNAPDILITIDSPGFTYRVAKQLKKILPNLKMIHIVAPSVWAYKPGRAIKYAKIYNCLFALLPFEPPYFIKVGLDCRYIGHPIMEQKFYDDKLALRKEFKILDNKKVLCVTVGSRYGEISRHLPIFIAAINNLARNHPDITVIFPLADPSHEEIIKSFLLDVEFNYVFSNERLKSYAVADLALAKSGTNILEIAASNTPMIVAYKLNLLSFLIIKLLIKIKYASIINIIAGTEVIPELIQFNCIPSMISAKLEELLLNPEKSNEQIVESQAALKQLGFKSSQTSSLTAAKIIIKEFLR